MKTQFKQFAREGIAHAKGQVKKLEAEIVKMRKLKRTTKGVASIAKIDDIIKWDKKLISDFKAEIATLKRSL